MKNGIYCENPVRVRPLGPRKAPWGYAITFEDDSHRRRIFFLDSLHYFDLDPDESYLFCARGRKILRLSPTDVTVGMLPMEYFWLRLAFVRERIPKLAESICEVNSLAETVGQYGLYDVLMYGGSDCAEEPGFELTPEINDIHICYVRSVLESLHAVGAEAFADILSMAIDRWNAAVSGNSSEWRNMDMFADLDERFRALSPTLKEVLNAYIENHPEKIYADFPKIDILF